MGKGAKSRGHAACLQGSGCETGAPTAVNGTSQLRHFVGEVSCSGCEEMGAALIGADQNILSYC